MATRSRSPEEIRASIEANRVELGHAVEALTHEVREITDWRRQLVKHQREVTIGAAAAGFILAGGLVAVGGLFGRRRK
ncbi:MAG: DUF3618 domain-containing protein [Solirubrobacteraceae bacterium]|nr:DUF3618 domain-containing protein [Solirubrobacteraceae bacterium]